MTVRDAFVANVWWFVRGDAESAEFEQWIYARSNELESCLGKQATLEVLAADYRSPEAVVRVREILGDYAERVSNLECRCVTLPNVAIIDMGEESEPVLATIEERRSRGEPFWWLWCGECTRCGQWWLVAQEERQNDVFCLRRLSDAEASALSENDIWRQTSTRMKRCSDLASRRERPFGLRSQIRPSPCAGRSRIWPKRDLAFGSQSWRNFSTSKSTWPRCWRSAQRGKTAR
jgi:hypothetical protein